MSALLEFSPTGNITPRIEEFNAQSVLVDGSRIPEEQIINATHRLRTNAQIDQLEALDKYMLQAKNIEQDLPDFLDNHFSFGLRPGLLRLNPTPIGYNNDGDVYTRSRLFLGDGSPHAHLSPTGLFGDCFTAATVVEQILSNPDAFPGSKFVGHANIDIPTRQIYYRIENGKPFPDQDHPNSWSHTFPIISQDGKEAIVDSSNFYGGFIIKKLIVLALDGLIPLSISPKVGVVPALTIPIALNSPVVRGGNKPYCEFTNSDDSTTLTNFRIFPNENTYAAQVELINQPECITNNTLMPSVTAFIIPGHETQIFPGGYKIGYFNGFIPGLVNTPNPGKTPPEMAEQLTQVISEFTNTILPKLN